MIDYYAGQYIDQAKQGYKDNRPKTQSRPGKQPTVGEKEAMSFVQQVRERRDIVQGNQTVQFRAVRNKDQGIRYYEAFKLQSDGTYKVIEGKQFEPTEYQDMLDLINLPSYYTTFQGEFIPAISGKSQDGYHAQLERLQNPNIQYYWEGQAITYDELLSKAKYWTEQGWNKEEDILGFVTEAMKTKNGKTYLTYVDLTKVAGPPPPPNQ